jgi:hypothetical protein
MTAYTTSGDKTRYVLRLIFVYRACPSGRHGNFQKERPDIDVSGLKLLPPWTILSFANTHGSRYILVLDIFVFAKGNIYRREYSIWRVRWPSKKVQSKKN